MLQNIAEFFELVGVDKGYVIMLGLLMFARCLVPNKLEYRIKETKDKDGNKKFDVFKIL